MKSFLILLSIVISSMCYSQTVNSRSDTLLIKQKVSLLLDNGFAIPSFSVSGDIYLTTNEFIFQPIPYRGKRYEMYNKLVTVVRIPYDSITSSRKKSIFGGLEIKTSTTTYKIEIASSIKPARRNIREIVNKINELRNPNYKVGHRMPKDKNSTEAVAQIHK